MSSIRKTLKFCSFAQAVIAACVIAIAIIAAIGVKVPANAGIGDIVALWIDKVLYLILGGLGFWDAFMGIFGANRPSALGKHRLVAIIIVPFGIITGIILGGGRGIAITPVISSLIAFLVAILDTKARKEADL